MASLKHSRTVGSLSSDTENNPKQVMTISLRSGKELFVTPSLHEEYTVLPEAKGKLCGSK
ncbi:hypothetical protein HAX54_020447, partial [Datura stramonium]|nr:hypothetical protein [Datura stramonium]